MQEVSFEDLDFSDEEVGAVATVTAKAPEAQEVSFEDLDFGDEEIAAEPEVPQSQGPMQGPRPERNIDRVRQAKEKVKAEGGSYQEQMEAAQQASTDFKLEQQGIEGQGSFGGGDTKSNDLLKGMEATIRGFADLGFDMRSTVGLGDEKAQAKNKETIDWINRNMHDEDFFSMQNMGRLIPTLATMPVAYSSKLLAFTVEGAIGYAESRGSGASKLSSAIGGAIAGGGTAAVMKAFEILGNKGSRVLDEITKEFDIPTDELDTIYKNFSKATGKTALTNYDKTVAILAQGERKGAEYFTIAAKADNDAKAVLDNLSKTRGKAIEKEIGGNTVESAIKPIQEQKAFIEGADGVEGRYNKIKELATEIGPDRVAVPKEDILTVLQDIPDIDKSPTIKAVIRNLNKEPDNLVTMEDLFDIREAMNGQTMKIAHKDKKAMKHIDGQQFIDDVITANMPEDFKSLWATGKEELRLSYAMKGKNRRKDMNNIFGTLLSEAGKPIDQRSMTHLDILDSVAKSSAGGKPMNDMLKTIGSDNMVKFEKGLVNEIYQDGTTNLDKVIKQLRSVEMTTPEGIRLKSNLQALDKAFSSDDFYKIASEAWKSHDADGTAITANLLSKLKYTAMGQLWNKVFKKHIPFTQEGKQLRHVGRVIKAIKESKPEIKGIGDLTPEATSEFQSIVRESIQSAIDDGIKDIEQTLNVNKINDNIAGQPKQIGMQDGQTHATVDLGNKPLNVTPEGQATDDLLEYNSKKLVSNFIEESMVTSEMKARIGMPITSSFEEVTDKIAGRVDTFMNTKRLQNVIKSYDKEIKGKVETLNKAEGFKVASKIIKQETENLIRNIEKDLGVKMPKSEAEKLIKIKIQEAIKSR